MGRRSGRPCPVSERRSGVRFRDKTATSGQTNRERVERAATASPPSGCKTARAARDLHPQPLQRAWPPHGASTENRPLEGAPRAAGWGWPVPQSVLSASSPRAISPGNARPPSAGYTGTSLQGGVAQHLFSLLPFFLFPLHLPLSPALAAPFAPPLRPLPHPVRVRPSPLPTARPSAPCPGTTSSTATSPSSK